MTGSERRTAAGEDRIDIIPGQQGTVVAAADAFVIGRLLEETGHARQCPCLRTADVDIILRVLEVVDIRGVVLRTTGRTCNQLSELTRETDMRGFLHMEEGNLVEHRREPLRLLLPVDVQTPYRVAQRFSAHRHLRGERLFGEMHHRAPQLKTLRKLIFPVQPHHRLALHAIVRVRLQRHVHIGAGINDALVQDGHLAGRVIDGIVRTLRQYHTARRHDDRPLGNIISIKGDDVGRRALILADEDVFVFLGILLGDGLRRVVEL